MRRFVHSGLIALFVLFSTVVCASDPMESPIPIAIVAQPLGESLRNLAKQANLQILFDSTLVAGKSARALAGTLTPRAALATLLRGSGLEAQEQAVGVVVIRKREPK